MSDSTTTLSKPPGIPLHMPVCMRFFDESLEEELHRGIVIHVHGKHFAVRSVEKIKPAVHTRADIYYRDQDHKFVRLQAVTARSHVDGDQSTLEMILLDNQGKYAEKRGTFRVSVADQGMTVTIDGSPDCRPLDISAEGMAVITARPLNAGQIVTVNTVFNGQQIDGMMIVRAVRERKDKKFRCGLQAAGKNKTLLDALQTIAMTVQRDLLSRLAGVETTTKLLGGGGCTAKDRTKPVSSVQGPDNSDEREPQRSPRPGGTQATKKQQTQKIRKHKSGRARDPSNGLHDLPSQDRLSFREAIDQHLTENDQRHNIRRKWRAQVMVKLPSKDVMRVIRTDAFDLSRGGYSFRTYREVPNGVIAKTEVTLGQKVFRISGTVRHCTRIGEREYRVGIQFAAVTRSHTDIRSHEASPETDDARDELVQTAELLHDSAEHPPHYERKTLPGRNFA